MDSGELRRKLTGTWFRSPEEESEGELVFRSPDYPFPPARAPRPAVRLAEDGTAVSLRAGPTDRLEVQDDGVAGHWAVDEATLTLRTPDLSGEYTLEAVEPGRLVVRPCPST
jgi:hypothetical protein